MPNPTKDQLKQKLKDLKEENTSLKKQILTLEEKVSDLKKNPTTSESFQSKATRLQLNSGKIKELL
jgi:cell division protein FtsB